MFAKLFREDDKQVLLMIAAGDDGPEVRVCFELPDTGVASVKFGFNDNEDGWNAAETAFNKITEEVACEIADKTVEEWSKED